MRNNVFIRKFNGKIIFYLKKIAKNLINKKNYIILQK